MDIYFLDHEPPERTYFEEALRDHQLHFLSRLESVPPDAQIVSVFIQSRIDEEFLAAHRHLRFVSTRSTTCDHIDLGACARAGVMVSFVPSYGRCTVAEHTFALILALARRLRQAFEAHRSPSFSYEALRGLRLRGRTLGVIGAGKIGLRVLSLARAFGMKCIAYDVEERPELAERLGFHYVTLPEIFACSDFISLHASLTRESYHILNSATLAQCKPGVMIINTARGALIDSKALVEALKSGAAGGAGLDVLEDERVFRLEMSKIVSDQILHRLHDSFNESEPRVQQPERIKELTTLLHNEELLSHPNVIFTPHIGFNSAEAVECIHRTTVRNIQAFLAGEPVNVLSSENPDPSHYHRHQQEKHTAVEGDGRDWEPEPSMTKIISTSEVLAEVSTPTGPAEVYIRGEGSFDLPSSLATVTLHSELRPCIPGPSLPQPDWLPREEIVKEQIAEAEATTFARDAFQHWADRVRRSIPSGICHKSNL